MPRCGCASDRCDCNFLAGNNIDISGSGSRSHPYVIEAIIPAGTGGGETGGGGTRLVGEIVAFGGSEPPAGWLMCDGSVVDRSTFASLFSVLGTAYGAGDGLTTFQLPNLVGRFPLGASGTEPRGNTGGSSNVVLTAEQLPPHTHSINHTHDISHDHPKTSVNGRHQHELTMSGDPGGSVQNLPFGTGTKAGQWATPVISNGDHSHDVPMHNGSSGPASTSASGAGPGLNEPVDTMPPFQTVNYIVKT